MGDSNISTRGRRQQNSLACEECRSRKLRCDMGEPQCGTCCNLGVVCITNPLRRPRGPRKGHVKTLKARIATLERQLYGDSAVHPATPTSGGEKATTSPLGVDIQVEEAISDSVTDPVATIISDGMADYTEYPMGARPMELPEWSETMPLGFETGFNEQSEAFPGFMILDSPLPPITAPRRTLEPPQEVNVVSPSQGSKEMSIPAQSTQNLVQLTPLECADLDELFFERVYPFAPIINRQLYFERVAGEAATSEMFSCLQQAMRLLAASMGSQFKAIIPVLYKYTSEALDTWSDNVAEEPISTMIVQGQLLLALYEILKEDPQKGWNRARRCSDLVGRQRLDQIDNPSMRRLYRLSAVEVEESRRTFWTVYALDRYAHAVHKVPLVLNDQMILTRLPTGEAAFQRQEPFETEFLAAAISQPTNQPLSLFSRSMVIVTLLVRCLSHKSQCHVDRITNPSSQEYLARHKALDKILTQEIEANLPGVSAELEPYNHTHLYVKMLAEAAVLVLFSALDYVSEVAEDVYRKYEERALKAVERIHSQSQRLSQLGPFKTHPFTPIVLFICGRFTRSCKVPNPNTTKQFKDISSSLHYLAATNTLAAMLHLELQQPTVKGRDPRWVMGLGYST